MKKTEKEKNKEKEKSKQEIYCQKYRTKKKNESLQIDNSYHQLEVKNKFLKTKVKKLSSALHFCNDYLNKLKTSLNASQIEINYAEMAENADDSSPLNSKTTTNKDKSEYNVPNLLFNDSNEKSPVQVGSDPVVHAWMEPTCSASCNGFLDLNELNEEFNSAQILLTQTNLNFSYTYLDDQCLFNLNSDDFNLNFLDDLIT
jgi:hypothetical protein